MESTEPDQCTGNPSPSGLQTPVHKKTNICCIPAIKGSDVPACNIGSISEKRGAAEKFRPDILHDTVPSSALALLVMWQDAYLAHSVRILLVIVPLPQIDILRGGFLANHLASTTT